jgi:hypothetical protein
VPIPGTLYHGKTTTIKNNFQIWRKDDSLHRKPPCHQAFLNHMRAHKGNSFLLHQPARHIQREALLQRQQLMGPDEILQPSVLCPKPRTNPQRQWHFQRTKIRKSVQRGSRSRKSEQPHHKVILRWDRHICRCRPIHRTPPKTGSTTLHHATES